MGWSWFKKLLLWLYGLLAVMMLGRFMDEPARREYEFVMVATITLVFAGVMAWRLLGTKDATDGSPMRRRLDTEDNAESNSTGADDRSGQPISPLRVLAITAFVHVAIWALIIWLGLEASGAEDRRFLSAFMQATTSLTSLAVATMLAVLAPGYADRRWLARGAAIGLLIFWMFGVVVPPAVSERIWTGGIDFQRLSLQLFWFYPMLVPTYYFFKRTRQD